VGVRLVDGRRVQRRFPRSALVRDLRLFCRSQVPEAAAGKAFNLAAGAGLGRGPSLDDESAALEAAGVQGALLMMTWAEE